MPHKWNDEKDYIKCKLTVEIHHAGTVVLVIDDRTKCCVGFNVLAVFSGDSVNIVVHVISGYFQLFLDVLIFQKEADSIAEDHGSEVYEEVFYRNRLFLYVLFAFLNYLVDGESTNI